MAQTPPPVIDPVPTPPIQRGDRTTFSSRVDAFILWLVNAVTQFRAVALNVYNNAVDAFNNAGAANTSAGAAASSASAASTSASNAAGSASAASTSATNAATSAGNASNSATAAATSATASAASAAALTATSTTSNSLSTGSKTFSTQAGKQFVPGVPVVAANPADGTQYVAGTITSYSGTSLVINATDFGGSGSLSNWNISVSGSRGLQGVKGDTGSLSGGTLTGALNEVRANNIASATAINLTNATGNLVHITGTTTITGITLQSGAERSVIFDSSLVLTNSSSLLLPSGANIATAPGDRALIRGDTAGAVVTHYQRADGTAVASALSKAFVSAEQTVTANGTLTIAHTLGVAPKIMLPFVRVKADGGGYFTNQIIGASPGLDQAGSTSAGCGLSADSSNIYVTFGGTSANFGMTNTNAAFFVRAFT
jgi:hypothetical protein